MPDVLLTQSPVAPSAAPAAASVAVGTASGSFGGTTFNATVASGENFLTVWIGSNSATSASTVTFDGVNMYRIGTVIANSIRAEVWGLQNPHVGTLSVVITGMSGGFGNGALSFKNVGVPPGVDSGVGSTFSGTTGPVTTNAVTSTVGGMVVGGSAASGGDPSMTTAGSSEAFSDNGGETVADVAATGGSQTTTWALGGGSPNVSIMTIALAPATTANANSTIDVFLGGPENHQSDVYLGQSFKTPTAGYSEVFLYARPTFEQPVRPIAPGSITFTGQATGVVTGLLFARTVHQGEPVTGWDNNADIAADGLMYGVVTVNYRNRGDIAALKSLNPNLKALCYFDPMASDSTDTGGANSGVDYAIANNGSNNSWFLLHSGSRIQHTSQSTEWMMDIGSRAYQNAVIANVLAHVQDGTPWDGIFFDEFGVTTSFAGFSQTPDFYPTESAWQDAITSFLTYVSPRLQAAGLKVFTNLADDYNSSPTGLEVSKRVIDLTDGYFEESWTDGGAGLAQQNPYTPFRIQVMQYAVTTGKIAYTHSQNTTEAGQTYALALNLCFGDQHTFHDRAWPDYSSEASISEYTDALTLRFPLGAATTLDSGGSQGTGVFMRSFQGGIVLANCETASFGPVSLGGTYSGSGLTGVTSVTIPAKTGYILLPEAAVVGSGAGTISFTGSASGTASHHLFTGAAAGTITVTGAAAGSVHDHVISGTAAGTITVTGAAAGTVHDHVFSGTAAGTITFTGAATGHAIEHGSASSTVTFTGLGAGTAHDHVFSGTAASTVTFTGAATGHITERGVASGTITFVGLAAGIDIAHFKNNFDTGQTSGTVITTGNSASTGNDAFGAVTGSPTYDSTHAHDGTLSMKPATGQSQVSFVVSSITDLWGRVYIYVDGVTGNDRIVQIDGNATTDLHRIALQAATNKLQININGGVNITSTNPINTNGWTRVEWHASLNGTTASIEAKLFLSPEAVSPDETLNQSGSSTDTTITRGRVGSSATPTAGLWLDTFAVNSTAYIGPSQVLGVGSSTVTFTGAAAGTASHHVFTGTAAGVVTFTGNAIAAAASSGTAVGTVTFTGVAAGAAHDHVITGSASGSVTFTGAATGHDIEYGHATGTVTVTGLAAGSASVHTDVGSGAGAVTFTGLASGLPHSSISTTDSASGSDIHSLTVIHQRGENGSVSETSVLKAIFSKTEVSTGADAFTLGVVSQNVESGTSSETSFEHATFAYVDTCAGTEASTIVESNFLVLLDSASGTEVASHSAAYVLTDVGTDYEKGVNSSHPVITIPLVIFEGGRIKVWLSGTAGDSIYYE